MQRCVNDVQFIAHALDHFGVHQGCLYVFIKGFIHFFADQVEQFLFYCFCLIHALDLAEISNSVYFCNDAFISGRYYLCAISPVYFVAVVFGGIVGCCQHNARCAAQFSDCEGQHGNGTQGRINEGRNTVCSKDQTCNLCKFRGHETGIVSNGYALVLCAFFQDIVCQALRSFPYCVLVQSVGAVADDAAQAACAEFQFLEEAFLDLVFIGDASQLCLCFLIDEGVFQPLLVSYAIFFHDVSSLIFVFIWIAMFFFLFTAWLHEALLRCPGSGWSVCNRHSRPFPESRYRNHRAGSPAWVPRHIPPH